MEMNRVGEIDLEKRCRNIVVEEGAEFPAQMATQTFPNRREAE